MYRYSIPQVINSPKFDKEAVLADLIEAGADRVYLALRAFSYDKKSRDDTFKLLRPAIKFFKDKGFEVGVWFWAFWVDGEGPFTKIKGFRGESRTEKCPLDPAFLAFMQENIRMIAEMHPDLILFDDDLRFGNFEGGFGCLCDRHKALMKKELGDTPFPTAENGDKLCDLIFGGKPNRVRDAFMHATGESLKAFCKAMREAVDDVDPAVRLGACACLSVWDLDGVDSYTLAKILAGNTKPFLRLIGAPYWGKAGPGNNRIQEVIEQERLECSWYGGEKGEMEIWSEGDAYPRPRFTTPASFMEIFDTALRASGGFDGCQKYMLDYTSSDGYERGYMKQHVKNLPLYAEIDRLFGGKTPAGIRVYEPMNKIGQADYSGKFASTAFMEGLFHSRAARFLASVGIPTVYEGAGCAGIAFGEAARHLPKEAFRKPLLLDLDAARILTENGVDVGIRAFGDAIPHQIEYYPAYDEYVYVNSTVGTVALTLDEKATVLSEWMESNGEFSCPRDVKGYPAAFSYENADGTRFLVFDLVALTCHESAWRNYMRPRQIADYLQKETSALPFTAFDVPDLYVQCKQDASHTVIGLWNCSPDAADDLVLTITDGVKAARIVNTEGTYDAKHVTVTHLEAYGYAFIEVTHA